MIEMFFCIFLIASNHIQNKVYFYGSLFEHCAVMKISYSISEQKDYHIMLYPPPPLLRNFFSQWCTLYIDSSSNLLLCFGPEEISMHLYRRAVQALKMIWKKCFGHYVNTVPFYYSLNLLRAVGNAHKWYEAIIPNHFKNVNSPT